MTGTVPGVVVDIEVVTAVRSGVGRRRPTPVCTLPPGVPCIIGSERPRGLNERLGCSGTVAAGRRRAAQHPSSVTVVPETALGPGRVATLSDVREADAAALLRSRRSSASRPPRSSSSSRSAGADLGAVWSTLQDVRPVPLAAAVACIGARLLVAGRPLEEDRGHAARSAAVRRDGRRGRGGEQRPSRTGRRPAAGALGVARRLLRRAGARDGRARPRLRHPRAGGVPPREPAVRDGRRLGRSHRARHAPRPRGPRRGDRCGSVVHAAAAARTTRASAPAAAVRPRHPRGALGSSLGPARSRVDRVEPRRVGRLGARGDASRRAPSGSSSRSSRPSS